MGKRLRATEPLAASAQGALTSLRLPCLEELPVALPPLPKACSAELGCAPAVGKKTVASASAVSSNGSAPSGSEDDFEEPGRVVEPCPWEQMTFSDARGANTALTVGGVVGRGGLGCVFAVAPRGSSSSALVLKLDAKVYRPARARCLPSPGCASPASLAELRGVLREASAYAKLRVPAALPPLPSSSPRRSGRGGNASLLPSFALAGVTSLYVERAAGGAVRTNVYGILLPRLGRSLYDATLGAGRSACVRAGRRLPLLCAAMLRSLRAAHAAGVVHNDVKPENFLFRPADALTDSLGGGSGGVASDRPHLVLIDFGLAVDAPSPDADPPATTAAVTTAAAAAGDEDDDRFEGTPAYASRNALSLGPLSPRDDCEAMLLVAGELAAAASKPWDAAPLLPWNEHEFYATKARRLSGGPKQVEDFMTCDTGGGAMPAWLRRAWALVDDRQRAAVAGGEHAPPYDDLMAVFHEAAREAACGGGGGGAAIDEADEEEGESSNSSSGSDGSGGKDWKCVRSQAESVGDHTAGEREP